MEKRVTKTRFLFKMKKYLTILFLLISISISAQEQMPSLWKLSGSFGPSYHLFYELSDFMTDQYKPVDISRNQKILSIFGELNYFPIEIISVGVFYQADLGSIDISSSTDIKPNYFYSSQSVGICSGYRFYQFGSLSSSANVFAGIIFHSLTGPESGLNFIPDSESSGYHYGIYSESTVELTENTNIVVMFGGEMKTSGTIKSNSSEYDFQSLNYFIRFGVDFEL